MKECARDTRAKHRDYRLDLHWSAWEGRDEFWSPSANPKPGDIWI